MTNDYVYELTRMEVFDLWQVFLKEQKATTKINLLKVLDENFKYSVSRKKRVYPFLPLKAARYRRKDVVEWNYQLLIYLLENNQAKVKTL